MVKASSYVPGQAALHAPTQSPPALTAIFSAPAALQAMLDVEAALARAQARRGVIPASAARTIARHCDASLFDMRELALKTREAGNLAIPLVGALTERVAAASPSAAKYVHWGATSQDVIDTAMVLQLRAAWQVMSGDLRVLRTALRQLARRHRRSAMTGRTLMQAAAPVSFGLKVAGWLDALERHAERMEQARPRCLVLQFGGAVGTLASLDGDGPAIAGELGRILKLPVPALSWHANRDRFGEVATALGLLVGTLGKMARDISLMMQSEIDEAREPAAPGRGGSSTLPHKRNPVACASVLAAALRAPNLVATMLAAQIQEHERGLGGWQAEWSVLPELVCLAGGALHSMAEMAAGLEIDRAQMRANIEARRGLIMAEAASMMLARRVGRKKAHELMGRASRRAVAANIGLREAIEADREIARHFDQATLDRVFDPARNLGDSAELVDAVLNRRGKR